MEDQQNAPSDTASDNTASQVQQNAAPAAADAQPALEPDPTAVVSEGDTDDEPRLRYEQRVNRERLILLAASIASGFATRDSDPEHIATRSVAIAQAIVAKVEG